MHATLAMMLACQAEPPETPPPSSPSPSTHPYTIQDLPEQDLEALSAALQSSLPQILTLQPAPVLASYQAALIHGGEGCPRVDTVDQDGTRTSHWQEICNNPDNQAWLNGPMTTWEWHEGYMDRQTLVSYDLLYQRFEPMRELRWSGQGLNGQTDIVSPEVDFNCSCVAISAQAQDQGTGFAFIALDGPSHWSGPEAQGTWMQQGLQVQLSGFASLRSGRRELLLLGNISGLDPEFGTLGFQIALEEEGGQCGLWDAEDVALQVRQSSTGHWVDLSLSELQDNSCTVCTAQGELCVDLAPLVAWEVLPW